VQVDFPESVGRVNSYLQTYCQDPAAALPQAIPWLSLELE